MRIGRSLGIVFVTLSLSSATFQADAHGIRANAKPRDDVSSQDAKLLTFAEVEKMRLALVEYVRLAREGRVNAALSPHELERLPAADAAFFNEGDQTWRASVWLLDRRSGGERWVWAYRVNDDQGRPSYLYEASLIRDHNRWVVTSVSRARILPLYRD